MKHLIALLLLALASVAGAAPEDDYPLLFQRNIFDPERSPDAAPVEVVPEAPAVEQKAQDWLRLAGVMIDGNQAIAFFQGSSPEYDAVVYLDEFVDELLLVAIASDAIVLYYHDEELSLPVGQGLRRDDEGVWQIAQDTDPGFFGAESWGITQDGAVADEPASDSSEMDLLERLRQRRNEELSNE